MLFIKSEIGGKFKFKYEIGGKFELLISNRSYRLKRGNFAYDYELMLCDCDTDLPRAILYGVMLPIIGFQVARRLFRPFIESFMSMCDDNGGIQSRSEVNQLRKEEAMRAIELMRNCAERIRADEEMKSGLVIIEARYGEMLVDNGGDADEYGGYYYVNDRTIDVTIPLQSMVADSQLIIYDSVKVWCAH